MMKNAKKFICILVIGCIVCTHSYNVYQTCFAAEAVAVGGLASAGVALLGLGAIAGVGMELDNNRRFNELSDSEKQRIENGLATNFEDVALQRGASVEKIKQWTKDLCNGVLDKTSECWGIFKDWIKDVSLSESPTVTGGNYTPNSVLPYSFTINYDGVVTAYTVSSIKKGSGVSQATYNRFYNESCDAISIRYFNVNSTSCSLWISKYKSTGNDGGYTVEHFTITTSIYNEGWYLQDVSTSSGTAPVVINDNKYNIKPRFLGGSSLNASYNGVISDNVGLDTFEYFSTNTDYLEKLKGQDEDVIDVIDVTDIKNPIIETRPNSLANINWNRGTRRTNNKKDDDDNKMVTGLVPMDVWYEQIDDEQEQMQNAVVVYNNYIQEHPESQGTYFIDTAPITNINNYFNTLPVVNLPTAGTIVNNNYEYNNYNNNNVTIYQEPYNAGIIPTFPDFKNKFPFCIPFDLYEFFVVFLAEKEAPKIDIPFPILDNTQHQLTVEYITIDLAPYEYVSDVLRVMLFVLFCVGLMILTRQLIKG